MERFSNFFDNFLTKTQQRILLFLVIFFAFGKVLNLFSYEPKNQKEIAEEISEAVKVDAKVMIDVRSASAKELEMVPGIGTKTAAKIIAVRAEFASLEDLMTVKGIGPAKFDKLKEFFVPFGANHTKKISQEKKADTEYDRRATSVNLNTAGVEELTTIKGIGKATAEKIVNYRNEHGKFKSTKDLINVKGIGTKKLESILPQVVVE